MKNANLRFWSIFFWNHWQKRESTAFDPLVIARACWLQLTDKLSFKLSHLGWIRPRIISSCCLSDLFQAAQQAPVLCCHQLIHNGRTFLSRTVNARQLMLIQTPALTTSAVPHSLASCWTKWLSSSLPPSLALHTCKAPAMIPQSCWLYYVPALALWPLMLPPLDSLPSQLLRYCVEKRKRAGLT